MSNPAGQLLEIIEIWQKNEKPTARRTRGLTENVERGRHVDAMNCLWQIKVLLETLDRNGKHRRSAVYWTMWKALVDAVMVYPQGWQNPENRPSGRFHVNTIDQLHLLDESLGENWTTDAIIALDRDVTLRSWIEDVLELAENDTELDAPLRESLRTLCVELLAILDSGSPIDSSEFVAKLQDLWRECGAAERAETEKKASWTTKKEWAARNATSFMLGMGSNMASAPLVQIMVS